MELQSFHKKILTSLEGPWRHRNNKKELHVPQMNSTWEMTPWLWLKRNANFPQAPQAEDSLSYRYVSGTQSLLLNGEWTMRCTDSKEGQITVQWLECSLVFLLTINMDVWIRCGEHRESPRSLPHYERRPHIPLAARESLRVQCFKLRWYLSNLENW